MSLITHQHLHVHADGPETVRLLKDLLDRSNSFMNAIQQAFSDFIAAQKSYNGRLETSVEGLGGDITALTEKVAVLTKAIEDAGDGSVPPEIVAAAAEVSAQNETMAAKFEALDALTPPVAPTA